MASNALFQEPAAPQEPAAESVDLDQATAEAPYGYTRDEDGTVRPKKTAGRRPRNAPAARPAGLPPSLDELKAGAAAPRPEKPSEDVPPAAPPKAQRSVKRPKMAAAPEQRKPFRAGPIATGVNRIYRRAGKIIRVWDPAVGQAVIECATKEDDDDVSVGEAWEELARVNPKVRDFLERIITGGAVGSVVAAHMPIVLAILLKDSVRSRLPMGGLLGAVLDRDDDQDQGQGQQADMMGGLGAVFAGMSPEDLAQMGQMAMGMMGPMMAGMPRDPGAPLRDVIPGELGESAA